MIEMSDAALAMVTGSYTLHCRAESWLGDTLLADSIPVAGGVEEMDLSLAVPERVTLTVPRIDDGFDWTPITPAHPLAARGQRLRVELGVDLGHGEIEWLPRGWFVISDTDPEGDSIQVQATGLLTLIQEARFVAPFQPSGTFTSTARRLVQPALSIAVTGLTDRAVPASLAWDEDRLQGLEELLDAWPADGLVDEQGVLQITPETTGASVLSLTDGTDGTMIYARGGTTRDGAYTAVVARGQAADGNELQGTALDTNPSSPLVHGGPFNPLPVPFFYFSPLLNTVAECRAAAATILARLRRRAQRSLIAEIIPHPGLRARDVVTVTSEAADLDSATCIIDALTLPYTADRGAMRLELRVVV